MTTTDKQIADDIRIRSNNDLGPKKDGYNETIEYDYNPELDQESPNFNEELFNQLQKEKEDKKEKRKMSRELRKISKEAEL